MLKEEDKIFKNLYGFDDWSLAGAKKRGIWSNTKEIIEKGSDFCLLYTSPSPRDRTRSRMPSSA